ncbi:hypothetical protein RRG08_022776 [Elysia crispata]|uniref:Neurotransmitter-gated ion-channel ligand-binding domain-containing protein n=1 Tax=Elysia crispata TaxID=231223 RepID=A0AAE1A2W4_9GAST|nr:hypothetical protein RRG08_022776 [Elysia crispata]
MKIPHLYHYGTLSRYDELPVRVFSSGDIVWSPTAVLSTACDIDVTYYPMDTQVCYIIFETSMSRSVEIDINIDTTSPISLADYSEDGQWEVIETSSENLSDEDSKTKIRFGVVLKRRRAYYVVNIVMPLRPLGSGGNNGKLAVPAERSDIADGVRTSLLMQLASAPLAKMYELVE